MTAVEWLWKSIMQNPFRSFEEGVIAYKQAKEMEKEQQGYSEEEVKKIMALTWLKCSDNNAEDFLENRNEILKQFKYNGTNF